MSFTSSKLTEVGAVSTALTGAAKALKSGTETVDKAFDSDAFAIDSANKIVEANTEKLSKEMEMAQRARQEVANRIASKRALQFDNTVIGGK